MSKTWTQYVAYVLMLFTFIHCKANAGTEDKTENDNKNITRIVDGEIIFPVPPSELSSPKDKAAYIIEHFWEPVNFSDTTLVRSESFMEQNFVNFISVFPYTDENGIKNAVFRLLEMSGITPESYKTVQRIAEKYLYDTNSPMLNETFYRPFLEYEIESNNFSAVEKEAAQMMIQSIDRNRPGSKAANFNFIDKEGNSLDLFSLFPDRDTILLFYDPECENCRNTILILVNDSTINNKIKTGKLGIIAVYSGENKKLWQLGLSKMPASWIVGYEEGKIEDNELYDLRSMPTMLYLSPDKTVIEKNFRINN